MSRDIILLTKQPELLKLWINIIVQYIRENYVDKSVTVDAIVGPETKGFVFAIAVALKLHLPYIPIRKSGKFPADPNDLVETKEIVLEKKV